LKPSSQRAAVLFAVSAAAIAVATLGHVLAQAAQSPVSPAPLSFDRDLVVLDPAHGGPDGGAALPGPAVEKDVTLAFSERLRTALMGAGFTVVSTRDGDPPALFTTDQRAEIANRAHPIVCLILHATETGSGVHIYTSTLQPSEPQTSDATGAQAFTPTLWDEAQSVSISQSLALAGSLTAALSKAGLPALSGRAALRPLDNLTCPAVAVELAPLLVPGSDPTPVTAADYQQHVAATIAASVRLYRNQAATAPPNPASLPAQHGANP
jgi:N-acetylmuramoyl-L-alanine amidase